MDVPYTRARAISIIRLCVYPTKLRYAPNYRVVIIFINITESFRLLHDHDPIPDRKKIVLRSRRTLVSNLIRSGDISERVFYMREL